MHYSIKETLQQGAEQLAISGINTATLDARILLEFVTGLSTEKLLLNFDSALAGTQGEHYKSLIARRCKFEPVAYITEMKEFYSLNFTINHKVLIPRPDSEVLVDTALKYAKAIGATNILEFGVGSGCLLLSILYHLQPTICATAIDISADAIEITRQNYQKIGLKNPINYLVQNWGNNLIEQYDLIIVNPPYIESNKIATLQAEVRNFEPKLALDGGIDGLNCYREISHQLSSILAVDGVVLFEIGKGQKSVVSKILQSCNLQVIDYVYDLANIIRCLVIKRS